MADAAGPRRKPGSAHAATVKELRACRIELETQNRSLGRAQLELDAQRAKYYDLFDLVPVGYLTLNDKGVVGEVNLAAASLLGIDRRLLVGQPFSTFVFAADRNSYRRHLIALQEAAAPLTFELRLRRVGRKPADDAIPDHFSALLEGGSQPAADGETPLFRVTFTDITEHKQLDGHSASSLRTVLETIPDLVWLKDTNGVYLSCNASFTRFFGAEESAIVGRTDYDFVDADLADSFQKHDRRAMEAAGPSVNEEWITFADDGHRALVETIKTPMHDEDGRLVGVLGIAREVTEFRAVQAALREREHYLRALIDNFPFLVWLKDTEGRFLAVNRAFAAACCGGEATDIAGQTDLDVWPTERAEVYRDDDRAVMESREQKTVEKEIVKQGSREWFETYKAPVFADDGQLLGTVGFSRDISDRKRVHEALRESEQNFRTFFESVDDMIVVGSPDGHIVYSNPAVTEKLGYSPREVAKMCVLDLYPRDRRGEAEDIFDAMSKGERDYCPLPMMTKSGELTPVETRIWRDRWNGADCTFSISKDLSAEQEALQKFDRLFQCNPAPMAVSDLPSGAFSDVNSAFLETLGFSREEVIGKTSADLGLFPESERQQEITRQLGSLGHIEDRELQVRRKDGTLLDGLFSGELIRSQGQDYMLTIMVDVTARKRAEAVLRQSEEKYRLLVENSHDIIYTLTADGTFAFVSPAWTALLGHPTDQVTGRPFQQFVHPDDAAGCTAFIRSVVETGQRQEDAEYRVRQLDGSWHWHTSSAVPLRDEAGTVVGLTGIARDMTKHKLAQDTLREQAIVDDLTGIFNRRHFLELAERELRRSVRLQHPLAIALLDVDHFKQVNDGYGHALGDQALVAFARICKTVIREIDVFARVGGDEFALLLPETTSEQARATAERVRLAVEALPIESAGVHVSMTVSVGVAGLSDDGETLDGLMRRADRALYQAKEAGRNRTGSCAVADRTRV